MLVIDDGDGQGRKQVLFDGPLEGPGTEIFGKALLQKKINGGFFPFDGPMPRRTGYFPFGPGCDFLMMRF